MFGNDVLAANIQHVQVQAAEQSSEERWKFLREYVLPTGQPQKFRVIGRFLTTHPAGEQDSPHDSRASLWKPATDSEPVREDRGGVVVSPVLDLLETARELGRLQELERDIKSRSAQTGDEHRDQLALLFLTAIARDDVPAATATLDAFIPHAAQVPDERGADRWPEVLILQQGLANPKTRAMVGEWANSEFASIFGYSPDIGLDSMNDHIRSLTGIFRGLRHDETASPLANWTVDSFADSSSRSQGRPTGCWQQRGHELHKLSGHEMDYLTYRVPLRGDFQVECDYTTGSGFHGGFVVAGRVLEMDFHQSKLKTGTYRKHLGLNDVSPKLGSDNWARFRAVVHDRQLQAFFNGQLVYEETLPAEHNPWVTFRSWRRSHPTMRDFHITGNPVIPDKILLTAEPDMPGWVPYYEHGFGANQGFWSAKADETGTVVVQGYPRVDVRGEGMEKWLRYHRPMVEDGTIEYEFFYQKDLVEVHPAIGRLAFLLKPDGVHTHWITDGRHETSGLDPMNADFDPTFQRGPEELPLREDAWNRLQLSLEGRTVRLKLNDEFIFERPLEVTNQREFGLFHYADWTEALVKIVVWQGGWPKSLPEQELVDPVIAELDRSVKELPAVWRHDFKTGAPAEWFDGNGDLSTLEPSESGVLMQRIGNDGLHDLLACLEFAGDFDVTARFQDFSVVQPEGDKKRGAIGLKASTNTASQAAAVVFRRFDWDGDKAAFAKTETKHDGRVPWTTDRVVEASSSGQLRLARRGDRIYALYAEGDSPNFRLIDNEPLPAAPIRVQGLKCLLQADGPDVQTRVVWNELIVRAEKIYGGPTANELQLATRLNEHRDAADTEVIEFTKLDQFPQPTANDPSVMVVTTPTTDGPRWQVKSIGYSSRPFPFRGHSLPNGTTDVEIALDVHDIETSNGSGDRTEVGVEMIFPYEATDLPGVSWPVGAIGEQSIQTKPYKVTWILKHKPNGLRWLTARVVCRDIAGRRVYLPIRSMPVNSPDRLRFVVDRGTLYFLYSEDDSDDWHVQAGIKIDRADFSSGLIMSYAYATTPTWSVDVTWKTLTLAKRNDQPKPEDRDEP